MSFAGAVLSVFSHRGSLFESFSRGWGKGPSHQEKSYVEALREKKAFLVKWSDWRCLQYFDRRVATLMYTLISFALLEKGRFLSIKTCENLSWQPWFKTNTCASWSRMPPSNSFQLFSKLLSVFYLGVKHTVLGSWPGNPNTYYSHLWIQLCRNDKF